VTLTLRTFPSRPRYPRASYPGMPHDRRRVLAVAALAVLLATGFALSRAHSTGTPSSLAQATLTGTRRLAGTACVGIADDVSASMDAVAPARRQATADALRWLHAQEQAGRLNADDKIAIAMFTDAAELTLAPTSIAEASVTPPADVVVGSGNTLASPVVTALADEFRNQGCAAVGLLAVSDGEVADDPNDLREALTTAGVTRMEVLNPKGTGRAPQLQDPHLSAITVHNVTTADDIGLAFGQLIADLTGQQLSNNN
jgi:hypothetical protein